MPAQNRQELLALSEKEFARLLKTIEDVDDRQAGIAGEDDISIKDTIAHRTHWIGLFLGWYADGKAGKAVETPAPGYKWNQLKEYNAQVRARSRGLSWQECRSALQEKHDALMALLTSLDDAELYTTHRYPWMKDWTIGRWAEASGPSHYRSAAKYIRKIKKDLATSAA